MWKLNESFAEKSSVTIKTTHILWENFSTCKKCNMWRDFFFVWEQGEKTQVFFEQIYTHSVLACWFRPENVHLTIFTIDFYHVHTCKRLSQPCTVQNWLFLIIPCHTHVFFPHALFSLIRIWCVYMTQPIILWSVNNGKSECLCSRPDTVTLCHYSSPLKGSAITADSSSWSCQGSNENRFWQNWHQAAKIILCCCCLGRSLLVSPTEVSCSNVMSMEKT